MKIRLSLGALCFACLWVPSLFAQDLGPHVRKIKDGIYVYTVKPTPESTSNCGIIVTTEGVVLIDTGQTAVDTREVAEVVKKLTPLPVRFIIDTETHPDHTYGHFLFSPPAVVIGAEGAGAEMNQSYDPERWAKQTPEIQAAAKGFRLIPPQIEYGDKLTLRLGERTFELLNLGTVHSLANTAIWLPSERVLFSASVAVPGQINTIRPHTNIADMFKVMDMMKALNPEVVIPGHGAPGGTEIFDNYERFLTLLLQRVGAMMREGKTLDQIKQELRMPEYENLPGEKERIANNYEAAYRAIQGGFQR